MKTAHYLIWLLIAIFLTSCVGSRYSNKLMRRGEENFAQGKYREAITNFNNALIWNRKQPRAYFWLGKIYEQQNKPESAITYYEKAFELQPNDKETALRLATLLISQKKYKAGVEILEKVFTFHPSDPDVGYLLSLALTYYGKPEESLMLIDKFSITNNSRLTYAKALASDSLGMKDYALIYYRRSIELDTLNPLPYLEIINHLKSRGEIDLTKRYLDAAITYFYDPFFHEEKLHILMLEYRWNEAIAIATTLFNLTSRYDFLEKRARLFQIQGQPFNALNDYNFILSADPTHLNSLYNRAILQKRLGNEKAVYNDLNRFLELADSTTPSWQVERAREIMRDYSRNFLPPKIKITYPRCIDGKYLIYEHIGDSIIVRGTLFQKSPIKTITVNEYPAKIYSLSRLKKIFVVKIPRPAQDTKSITAIDIYNNTYTWEFGVLENESSSPEIIILSPQVDTRDTILQTEFSRWLNLKLLVADKNLLSSLTVNQQTIPLKPTQRTFFADTTLTMPPFDTITITASDIFGNVAQRILYISKTRRFLEVSDKDVLIVFFRPKISSPAQNVSLETIDSILTKFSNAEIQTIKPQSKFDLERFIYFSLPAIVRANGYKHLFLFFEGEAHLLFESLYWSPNVEDKRATASFNFSFLSTVREELGKYSTTTVFINYNPTLLPSSINLPQSLPILISSPETPPASNLFAIIDQTIEKFHRVDIDYVMNYLSTNFPQYHKALFHSEDRGSPKVLFRLPNTKQFNY